MQILTLTNELLHGTLSQPSTILTRRAAEVIIELHNLSNELLQWKLQNQEMKVVEPTYLEAKYAYGEVMSIDNT